jgi:glycosyltransferase involved in cell wall biosynthesis
MNILCLTDAFWPDHAGGISKSLLPEIEGLAGLGHRLTVVSRRLRAGHPQHESRNGYELYRYFSPSKGSFFYWFYPLFSFIALPRLVLQLHRQHPFDVAYVHNLFQAVGLSRALPDLPYVYEYHASAVNEIRLDATRRKYGWLSPLVEVVTHWVMIVEDKALSNAHQIIVHSQFMSKDLRQLHTHVDGTKIVRIPLCVDTERFGFAETSTAPRRKLGLPEDRPILLTVRRLVARMGVENLLTAMRLVVRRFPKAFLLIGGAGYLQSDLQRMIKQYHLEQNVTLLGFIPEEALPNYYRAADLFVLPTLAYEGFGLVTIEALACGTPVIATPVGAIPEVLGPLGQEFLLKDNSFEAIAEGIVRWLAHGLGVELRRRCRTFCVDHFSRERICYELERVLVEAAAAGRTRP